MKRHNTAITILILAGVANFVLAASNAPKQDDGGDISERFEETSPGVLSLSGSKTQKKQSEPKPYEIVKDLADDAEFLKIGNDILKWGDVRNYIDSIVGTQLKSLFGATANSDPGMGDIQLNLYGNTLSRMLSIYAMTALVAQEAKKEGLAISDSDIAADLETLRKRNKKLYPFQYQLVTNLVYQRAYIEKHIKPNIKVTDHEIATLIKWRHDSNLSVPLTNAIFRASIEDIRKQIVDGTLEFGEAAEEFSECSECSSNNGDCGPWEEDIEDFDPALKEYCFSAPTNVLSDVIEGEEAFHIVKITNRHVPTQKAREEDGEVSSVEFKHIQIDKWLLDPEFTKETATQFIEKDKISFELSKIQEELKATTPITSILPLYERRKGRKKTPDFTGSK